ncbi:hypothetical protein [Aquimarina addita]
MKKSIILGLVSFLVGGKKYRIASTALKVGYLGYKYLKVKRNKHTTA